MNKLPFRSAKTTKNIIEDKDETKLKLMHIQNKAEMTAPNFLECSPIHFGIKLSAAIALRTIGPDPKPVTPFAIDDPTTPRNTIGPHTEESLNIAVQEDFN